MNLSLNEIEATLRMAAVGAGWPHGLAEDFGRAAGWLMARGHDVLAQALAALRPQLVQWCDANA